MKKIVLLFLLTLFFLGGWAQPASLEGDWNNGNWSSGNTLTIRGGARAVRIQATGTATRDFLFNNSGNNYNPKWVGSTSDYQRSLNNKHSDGAFHYTSGGWDRNLQFSATNNYYYTFIIGNNSSANNDLSIIETSFNPVTISNVTQTPTGNPVIDQPITVNITTSSTPNTDERIYVRYTTDNFSTSTIVQATGSGTSWSAEIPGQSANTTVEYYVLSSKNGISVTHADADYQTLELNNNSGSNYSYTVQNAVGNRANGVGGCDGNWSTSACWFNNAVPNASGTHVNIINSILLDQNATVASLVIQSGATLTSEAATARTLTVAHNGSFIAATGTFTANNGKVEFTGAGTITGNIAFNNLDINPTSAQTVSLSSGSTALTINGKLHIYGNGTLDFNGNNMYINGDIQRDETIGALNNMGLVTISGNSNQNQTGNITYLGGLTINKSGGSLILNTNGSNTGIDIPNGQTLTLTNGVIDAATNSSYVFIQQGGSISAGSNSSHVNGELRRATNGTSEFNFPVGVGGVIRPVGLTPQGSGATTFAITAGGAASNPTNLASGVNNVSTVESWDISRISGSENAKIKLYWNSAASGIDDVSEVFVAHYTSGNWTEVGSSGSGNSSAGYVETNGYVSSFSPFTFGSGSSTDNPLPVTLTKFNATLSNNDALIFWQTANELNCDRFDVYRSFGNDENKEFITSIEGQGTTSSITDYATKDYNIPQGMSIFYYLHQIDFDGQNEWFGPVKLTSNVVSEVNGFFNKEGNFVITLKDDLIEDISTIFILNTTGQVIKTISTSSDIREITLSTNDLASGVYFINVQNGANIWTLKALK